MDIGVIFSIIGLVCGFLVAIIGLVQEKMSAVVFGIFLVCFNAFTLWINAKEDDPLTPTALDVYRGRTTLQITYEDSVALDSIVVFKKGYD
jgi:type IV secretory pathway TrbD component